MITEKPLDIDEYIAGFPPETGKILNKVRKTIHKAVPEAEEAISYGMPAFRYNGMLVYFAGYKNHIGFYPTPSGISAFKKEFSTYKWAKGSVQFPLDEPMPVDLITRITKFRAIENLQGAKLKKGVGNS